MHKVFSTALLVGGVAIVVFGISAAQSFGSDISRFVTGSLTDKAVWMLAGGAVLCIIGLSGLLRGSGATA